jgi:intein-encoded DNA endonuclease-like protein
MIDMYTIRELNTVQIAKIFRCSDSTVGRILRDNGVKIVGRLCSNSVRTKDYEDICKLYIEGKTTEEIAKIYNKTDNTIAKVLRKNGIELRKAIRRSHVKHHDYFENIDTPEKAYYLGWILTDGSVVEHKTRTDRSLNINMCLQNSDRKILVNFMNQLGAGEDSVHFFEKRKQHHISFASQKMADDLSKYGIVPRKSYKQIPMPNIREDLIPHLLRGIFDGNGSNYITKDGAARFTFYGNKALCESIREYLNNEIGAKMNDLTKRVGCYSVSWQGNDISQKFCDLIYKDCGEHYLDRKREKFAKVLNV